MCPRLPLPPVGVSSRVRPLACSASLRLSSICCVSRTWTCSSRSTGAQLFLLVYALALGKSPSVLLTIIAALGLPMVRSRPLPSYEMPVCSLFGVALIARPQFLFDGLPGKLLDFVTPQQRMTSEMSGRHRPSQIFLFIFLRSAALVGVVGASGTREFGFRQLSPYLYPYRSNRHSPPRDWKASTSTPR